MNLLTESDAGGAADDVLTPGEAVPFGIAVDLVDADLEEVTGDPEITLTIIADTGGTSGDDEQEDGDEEQAATPEFVFTNSPSVPGPPGQTPSIQFTVENTGSTVSIVGFRIEWSRPGNNTPATFSEFSIDEGNIEVSEGYNIGEAVYHESILISQQQYVIQTVKDSSGEEVNTQSALSSGEFKLYLIDSQDREWLVDEP